MEAMTDETFNRRLFSWVLWIFVGLVLLVLLTSCSPISTITPAVTETPSATAVPVTTVTGTPSPTLTPTPTDKPNKCRLDKGGNRIADCYKKGN